MRFPLSSVAVFCIGLFFITSSVQAQNTLNIIVPKSLYDTGIVTSLIEGFKEKNPAIEFNLQTTGALKVIEEARKGKADFILSHYPQGESIFITEGYALQEAEIMYNYFAVLGPQSHNLDFSKILNIKDLFRQLQEKELPFVTPHPRSGTTKKLESIAAHYGFSLETDNIESSNSNVKTTIALTDELEGYTFADLGSYLKQRDNLMSDMVPLFSNDIIMQNHIRAIVINPEKIPAVNSELAMRFWLYLISEQTQKAIAEFGQAEYNMQIFTPNAHVDNSVIAFNSQRIIHLKEQQALYQNISIALLTILLIGFVLFYINKQRHLRQQKAIEERFAMELDASQEGIWEFNYQDNTGYLSSKCQSILGLSNKEHLTPIDWFSKIMDSGYWQSVEHSIQIQSSQQNTKPFVQEFRIKNDPKDRAFRLRLRLRFKATGELEYIVGAVSDLSAEEERQDLVEHLRYLATHDNLTGLPNRQVFIERLNARLLESKRDRNKFSVLFLDLNNFKPINDDFGHHIGDQLLIKVAHAISSSIRQVDLAARYAGDEFVVLLHNTSKQETKSIAQKIADNIQAIEIKQHTKASASIGFMHCANCQLSSHELMKRADQAMYHAKKTQTGICDYADIGIVCSD